MIKFLNALPLAFELARIAEAAVPLGGKGKAKLDFALTAAETMYQTEEDLRASWKDKSKFLESIGRAINVAVSLLNAAGIFKKSAPAQ